MILVGGPTRMPIIQKFVESEVGQKIERGIDPMECVALGAAVQAAIIKGETKEVLLLDVTPLSLGIEVEGGIFNKLIERNTTIPTKKFQEYSTAADNQTGVTIRVLQGERPMANDNTELGRFDLQGIPPAPRGVPKIEVTFDIDADGIVHVSAKDKATGKEQKIKISAPKKLSPEEIDRMVKEAEKFAAQDVKRKEEVEIINQANSLVYATEKGMKEYGDKVSASDRATIEQELNGLKDAVKDKNRERIKKTMESLQKASHKLAEEMYKSASAQTAGSGAGADGAQEARGDQGGPSSSGSGSGGKKDSKDDIIDADFKAEDEK